MKKNSIFTYFKKCFKKLMSDRRGTWAAIAAATITTGGNIYSSKQAKKNKPGAGAINLEDYYPSWTKSAAGTLSPWVQKYLPQFQPGAAYTGKRSAGMTPQETSSMGMLDKYMAAPDTGELYDASKQQVMDTLGGKFADPNQSPFIKSMINMSKMNLQDQITTERGQRGARGTYYTDAGVAAEGKLGERTQNFLNTIIGQFVQGERDKQFQAVPLATQMDEYTSALAPLKKISAGQSLGSLQRIIDQAGLESAYQDFVRQRGELSSTVGAAQSLISPGYAGGGGQLNAPQTDKSGQNMQSIMQMMQLFSQFFNKGGSTGAGRSPGTAGNWGGIAQ